MLTAFSSAWSALTSGFRSPARQNAMQAQAEIKKRSAEQERIHVITRARAAYDGDWPDPLTPTRDGMRDSVRVNHVAQVVDTAAAFLMAPGPAWELPDFGESDDLPSAGDEPAPDPPQVAKLKDALDATAWEQRILDLAIAGDFSGTPYLRVYPADALHEYPRLVVLDPACMRIDTDPQDCDTVIRYVWQYQTDEFSGPTGYQRILQQRIERGPMQLVGDMLLPAGSAWVIVDEHSDDNGLTWQEDHSEPWPHEWPPLDHCKNWPNPNSPYGKPGVSDILIDLNYAINFNLSNRQRIDRYHSSPVTVLTNADAATVIDRAVNAVIQLDEGATYEEHYPHIDSQAGVALGQEIFGKFCETAMTPAITLGHPVAQESNPSGVALRTRMGPLLIKIGLKRELYGPLLIRALQHMLELLGYGPNLTVTLSWPELLPTDPLTEREVLTMDMQAGVLSREGYCEKVDIDWPTEKARLEDEAKQAAAAGGTGGLPPAPGAADAAKMVQAVDKRIEMQAVTT